MSKPLALVAALLLLAGCNASNPVAPATSEPSFAHGTNGCPTATARTVGTEGAVHVTAACTRGK
jgi:hypothetical protein